MDCGTTGTAAGIDPKILDNWQSDTFPISSWEQHPAYDQPLEWDASQDSSPGDADIVDLNTLRGPLSRDQSTVPVVGHAGDFRGSESRCELFHPPLTLELPADRYPSRAAANMVPLPLGSSASTTVLSKAP